MPENTGAPRFAWVEIDRRPRGWGSMPYFAQGVFFPALVGGGLLVWCVHGFMTHGASRPHPLYLIPLSIMCVAMLHITVGFTFGAAVARGWVPEALAFVGRRRTVIFQGGVFPRLVSYGGGSGAYEVTRKVSSIGGIYWTVKRGASGTLNLAPFGTSAVPENDEGRLAANFARLNEVEAAVRAPR